MTSQPDRTLKSSRNCAICGQALTYGTESKELKCSICGKAVSAQIYCAHGHYVCDGCHSCSALEALLQLLNQTTSPNPAEILEKILQHPSVPMHGPEHHAFVPAILITAVKNSGYSVPGEALKKAMERGSKVPGGWCGFFGDCGAAVGVGITTSILTEATPLTGKQRSLSLKATGEALLNMIDGHPRCCKRASRDAIRAAVDYLRKNLNIVLPEPGPVKCTHASLNQQCPKEECRYYQGLA